MLDIYPTTLPALTFEQYMEECESGFKKNKLQSIAHHADSAVIEALENVIGKNTLEDAIGNMLSIQMGQILSTGITIDERNFPEMYTILRHCCAILGIAVPHTVITNDIPGINAFTCGTDGLAMIAVSGQLSHLFTEGEQQFIIGHECGHIAMGHVVYHSMANYIGMLGSLVPVLGPLVANTINLPLAAWSRCSEITADRAGFLCCGDLKTAQRALLRLVGGFKNIDTVDIDAYIEASRNSRNAYKLGTFAEFFQTHPLIPKRIQALDKFANSEPYANATGKAIDSDILTDEQLHRIVAQIMRIV